MVDNWRHLGWRGLRVCGPAHDWGGPTGVESDARIHRPAAWALKGENDVELGSGVDDHGSHDRRGLRLRPSSPGRG